MVVLLVPTFNLVPTVKTSPSNVRLASAFNPPDPSAVVTLLFASFAIVAAAPFCPLGPVGPAVVEGAPFCPFCPLGPVGPVGPISPFCPFCPLSPFGPVSPVCPFWPLSPWSPVVTNDTIISSLFVNGEVAELASLVKFNVQKPVPSVKSVMANVKNCVESNLLDILIWPFTADVFESIVCKVDWISFPLSSVSSIYPAVAAFWVVLFSLILPVPGSVPDVDVSNV